MPPRSRHVADPLREADGLVEFQLFEQGGASHCDPVPIDGCGDAAPGDGVEVVGGRHVAEVVSDGDDRTGDRMLAVGLSRGGEPDHVIDVPSIDRRPVDDGVVPLRQGSGLVEQDGVDRAHPLERQPILDQDAGPCRRRGGDRDHERDRQPKGMGAGDHEDRHRADDPVGSVADRRPGRKCDDRSGGRHVEQRGGCAVGEHLGARVRALCVGDESPDTGQRRVVADGVDTYPNRPIRRHGPGDDTVSFAALDGPGFAGDHRFVHRCGTSHDLAVGRHSTTGPDQDDVTESEIRNGDLDGFASFDPLRSVRQEFGERGERALGLSDRFHLLPVAEQHDHDQRRQLPPEVEITPAERARERRSVGDGDRQCDQQHHPGPAAADLVHGAGEKRPAAPQVDDRADHRRHPRRPAGVDRVPEPVLDHLGEPDHRDGEQQVPPEQPPERLRVVTSVLVVPPVTGGVCVAARWWLTGAVVMVADARGVSL